MTGSLISLHFRTKGFWRFLQNTKHKLWFVNCRNFMVYDSRFVFCKSVNSRVHDRIVPPQVVWTHCLWVDLPLSLDRQCLSQSRRPVDIVLKLALLLVHIQLLQCLHRLWFAYAQHRMLVPAHWTKQTLVMPVCVCERERERETEREREREREQSRPVQVRYAFWDNIVAQYKTGWGSIVHWNLKIVI